MNIALITGSAGLIGSESVEFFAGKFDLIVGIDNNMRQYFFGADASTEWNKNRIEEVIPNYRHYAADIRDYTALEKIFAEYAVSHNRPLLRQKGYRLCSVSSQYWSHG